MGLELAPILWGVAAWLQRHASRVWLIVWSSRWLTWIGKALSQSLGPNVLGAMFAIALWRLLSWVLGWVMERLMLAGKAMPGGGLNTSEGILAAVGGVGANIIGGMVGTVDYWIGLEPWIQLTSFSVAFSVWVAFGNTVKKVISGRSRPVPLGP